MGAGEGGLPLYPPFKIQIFGVPGLGSLVYLDQMFGVPGSDFWRTWTRIFGVPGSDFWRTLTRCLAYLDQIFGPDFEQDLYSAQFYWDGEMQCTVPQGRRAYKTY